MTDAPAAGGHSNGVPAIVLGPKREMTSLDACAAYAKRFGREDWRPR